MQGLTGVEVRRIHVDKGCQGHTHLRRSRVWISDRVRGVTKTIRREMRRGRHRPGHRPPQRRAPYGPQPSQGPRRRPRQRHPGRRRLQLYHLLLGWLAELLRALIAVLFNTQIALQSALTDVRQGYSQATGCDVAASPDVATSPKVGENSYKGLKLVFCRLFSPHPRASAIIT